MKVLFAVSSESISDAIIKRYQKEHKEILSYKNVYYFNAILKEIQRDKTYDRIVISEDLEPFSNSNYETIDKFIFEKLDSISDEAQDSQGKETSIILICTDRHTKGSSILVKLFGIGVYNALLGNDRSMEQVCKLINKPRTKKEAKMYYKIDTDDVNYRAESENEVSELEIQNILNHFKKLGKNTDRYADSFNNISTQYTDEQLKIIINCLPITIKGVLEEECQKYQEIMSVSGGGIRRNTAKMEDAKEKTGIKIDIIENKLRQTQMTGPIVIPSSVRTSKQKSMAVNNVTQAVEKKEINELVRPSVVKVQKKIEEPEIKEDIIDFEEDDILEENVSMKDELLPGMFEDEVNTENTAQEELLPEMFEETEELLPNTSKVNDRNDIEIEDEENNQEETETLPVKKGRGRPRIKPIDETPKPKGKRGRPKKIVEEITEEVEEVEEELLPGMFEDEETTVDIDQKEILPGIIDEEITEEDDEESDALLPGMFDEVEEDDTEYTEEVSLSGLDELDDFDEEVEDDSNLLPGINDEDNEFEEDLLLGISDEDDEFEEDLLPGISGGDGDFEEDILPGINNEENQNHFEESEEDEEETLLPGMGFEENEELEDSLIDTTYNKEPIEEYSDNMNDIESIKSTVDYSMSSLNSLLTKDKKIVTFLGTTKNGTSFLINNLAALFSSLGINTAVLDMTKNRNSYYIYTQNEEELRKIAYNSIEKLQNGYAEGIKVDKNLTVYTALPNDGKDYSNADPILSTLVQNHSLILIDCDFETAPSYFASCQEIYLVQSMDILTIQPLTGFLRELKTKGVLESEKIRVVINKEIKVRSLTSKVIIGGMSFYNDPAMSFMTELFNKDMVKACSIPFEDNVYSKYLEAIVNCNISLNGYSKAFLSKLRILGDMVYPLTSKQTYGKQEMDYSKSSFSNNMNDTLKQMKNKY